MASAPNNLEGISGWRRERLEKLRALGAAKFILYRSVLPFTGGFTVLTLFFILSRGSVLSVSGTLFILIIIVAVTTVASAGLGWLLWLRVDADYEELVTTKGETPDTGAVIMSETASDAPLPRMTKKGMADAAWVVVLASILIYKFLFALMPVEVAPSPSVRTLTILIEMGMTLSLIGFGVRILRSQVTSRSGWALVMIVGCLAGLGLLGIRMSGGPRVVLPPRTQVSTPPDVSKKLNEVVESIPKPAREWLQQVDAEKRQREQLISLKVQLADEISSFNGSMAKLNQTRWVRSRDADIYHPRTITLEDLRDYNSTLAEVRASTDRMIEAIGANVMVPASEKDYWQMLRDLSSVNQQQGELLEANWAEWHKTGVQPKRGESKPWQRKVIELQERIQMFLDHRRSASSQLLK